MTGTSTPTDTRGFEDAVALVTGATSGIGRATALEFAERGADVVIAGRREERGAAVVEEIEAAGGRGRYVKTDVTEADQVENLVETTVSEFGGLDAAFNNAGGGEGGPLHELTEDDWDGVVDLNLKATWLSMKYEIPAMLSSEGDGAIVNMSSIFGPAGVPGFAAYAAAEMGTVGLTKTAAVEYADRGIRVNAIGPGTTLTPLTKAAFGGDREAVEAAMADAHPLGRVADPEEVAGAVVWLCSNRASFVTGDLEMVDGGYTAR